MNLIYLLNAILLFAMGNKNSMGIVLNIQTFKKMEKGFALKKKSFAINAISNFSQLLLALYEKNNIILILK